VNMIPVTSSNLSAVGFDHTNNTLRIRFHNGTYDYLNVPSQVYQGLMNASSKGSYHARNIKDVYQYRKV
jgi:hypothetical protein